jgi:hypothetical protein
VPFHDFFLPFFSCINTKGRVQFLAVYLFEFFMQLLILNILFDPKLARISHKDRCERPESAMNTGLQRQKAHRQIEIFRGRFLELYPRKHGAFRPCSRSLVRNAG